MLITPTINSVHGRILSITGTDPAAGVDISETVPSRRRWRILALYFTLVTSATEANRYARLLITDGTNVLYEFVPPTPQTAGGTNHYSFSHFPTSESIGYGRRAYPLPPLMLTSGYKIQTALLAKEADDNLSAPQLLVEEWIDP
ncbi:hypothetical protein ES703_41481 [subsurface metagenome]|nr:hypothetical protein [Dehalococcoidia bacterium]